MSEYVPGCGFPIPYYCEAEPNAPIKSPLVWDCAIGTPDEDHDWHFVGGDSSVGVSDAWVCRACGKVDETDMEPPSEEDDYGR